jgi:hypothetical protein
MEGMAEFLVSVIVVFAAGTGVALTLSGDTASEFLWARICYLLAAAALLGVYFYWTYEVPRNSTLRLFLGAVVGVIVVAGTPELLRWVNFREALATTREARPAVSEPTIVTQMAAQHAAQGSPPAIPERSRRLALGPTGIGHSSRIPKPSEPSVRSELHIEKPSVLLTYENDRLVLYNRAAGDIWR